MTTRRPIFKRSHQREPNWSGKCFWQDEIVDQKSDRITPSELVDPCPGFAILAVSKSFKSPVRSHEFVAPPKTEFARVAFGICFEAMTTSRRFRTISSMRFDSSPHTSPPLGPSWRVILWALTLVPALWILGWSLRHARVPKQDVASAGTTADEAVRLQRILKDPPEVARLKGDAVRFVEAATEPGAVTADSATPGSEWRLDKSILSAIKDNSFGVTAAEKPAYQTLLAKVRNLPLAELERSARQDVPFAVLMLDADRFRGELLTIEGDIRRLSRLTPSKADASAVETFEAWLFTSDSGLNPYRIVLATVPERISFGDDLKPPVPARITGYFFKRYSYATANDFHTAPLLLANSLTPLTGSRSAAVPRANNSRWLTRLAIGSLVVFALGGLAVELVACRRRRRRRQAEDSIDSPPDLSWLQRP